MVVGDVATAVDVIVLGAGPGGCSAAIRAARLGKDVVLVEPGPIGGGLSEGRIPANALLTAVDQAWQARHLDQMGIETGQLRVDFARMQRWKQEVVGSLRLDMETALKRYSIDTAHGRGWFLNEHEMRVEGPYGALKFIFEQAVIAVGAKPAPLPGLPFDAKRVLTPGQALKLNQLPEQLAIIGADCGAVEVAVIFAKLGVPVRLLIPAGEQLLPEFDPGAGQLIETRLQTLGVTVEQNVADPVAAVANSARVVVSAGVLSEAAGLALESAQVVSDEQGFIPVNARQQTNQPHIYAVGAVTGDWPYAAVAVKQGSVAAEALAGRPVEYAPQAIPKVAWTDPPAASVGLTAAEAEAAGYKISRGHLPLKANRQAQILDAATGTVLIVAEQETELLLGVTIIAPLAHELIGEAALALEMGATLTDLVETLHPYPSLSKSLPETAEVMLSLGISLSSSPNLRWI